MVEIELKFQLPAERRADVAAALGLTDAPRSRLQAQYFDTAQGLLAAHQLSLRLRKEGRTWVQTLKAPGDNAVHRFEHNVPRPGRWGEGGPALDIGLHAGTPAGERLQACLQPVEGGLPLPLQVVYRSDVRRRLRVVSHQGAQIELALDEGELLAGDRSAVVSELELELKEGPPAALFSFAEQAVSPHALWLSTVPKAARGERLAEGRSYGPASHASSPRLGRKMAAAQLQRAAVGACLAQVLANASEVADGCRGDEHVHQLRVGLRRLRTVLRELAVLGPGMDPAWEAPLAQVFGELGAFRDQETVGSVVAAQLNADGAPAITLPLPDRAPADPVQAVRGEAFQRVLLALLAFTMDGADGPVAAVLDAPEPRKLVAERLARLHRQVTKDGRRFDELEEAQRHRVRKRLKRLRYLAELVEGLFERKKVRRYLANLRPAQDALGAHNDDWVALGMYRDAAERGAAEAWFAVGWLQARLPMTVTSCRKALTDVKKAQPFW